MNQDSKRRDAVEKLNATFNYPGKSVSGSEKSEMYTSGESLYRENFGSKLIQRENFKETYSKTLTDLQKKYSIGNSNDEPMPVRTISRSAVVRSSEKLFSLFKKPQLGLSKYSAAMFIIVSVSGNGATYLPFSLKGSKFFGIFISLTCWLNSFYCACLIGQCRLMMQESWPECKVNLLSPYPEIGSRAVGKYMKHVVSLIMNLAILNRAISLLCYMSNILDIITNKEVKFCILLISFAVVLTPLTWIKTLRNLWHIVWFVTVVILLFVFLLLVAIFVDKGRIGQVEYELQSTGLASYAIVMFALGSGVNFPSIQNEMQNRRLFIQSAAIAYIVIFIFYLPLPLMGYAAYGKNVRRSIILNIADNKSMFSLVTIIEFLFLLKTSGTFLVTTIPLFLNIEDYLKCHDTSYKRCLLRSFIVLIILLLGLLFHQCEQLLVITGATLLNMLTFLFPVIFYICLVFKKVPKKRKWKISKKEWIVLIEILIVSILGGMATIFLATKINFPLFLLNNCYTNFLSSTNHSCYTKVNKNVPKFIGFTNLK